ncbi:UDP-sugar:glycosyltransferase [Striga asiatica]|uniref:UDP-sugar:glycosyltransferase n=1 Tax=Striga asiatica TaxID=4170 RepID=A0A5A7QM27_STRAF|nr:UDP-sugar:glycosyltransferase [Striga asiatica]
MKLANFEGWNMAVDSKKNRPLILGSQEHAADLIVSGEYRHEPKAVGRQFLVRLYARKEVASRHLAFASRVSSAAFSASIIGEKEKVGRGKLCLCILRISCKLGLVGRFAAGHFRDFSLKEQGARGRCLCTAPEPDLFEELDAIIFLESRTLESSPRIRFVDILRAEPPSGPYHPSKFIESHKDHVQNEAAKLFGGPGPNTRLAGFVVDIFCTSMADVA